MSEPQPNSASPAGSDDASASGTAPRNPRLIPLHTQHGREFASNRFVYPVLSRRSRGISIGVNLNPDKACNFDCIYCQVDRTRQSETRFVAMPQLLQELDAMLEFVLSGQIFETSEFAATPPELRRLNDIAFSGDGEPTTYRNFDEIIGECAAIKSRHGANDVKMVLITNASMFHRPHVQRGLEILDANSGEIWAKLDAGTAEYYQLIDRTVIPFQRILDNITAAAIARPIVIQALFMKVHGEGPTEAEILAFTDRLNEVTAAGGTLKLVQVYTVARLPAESFVSSLANETVDHIAECVRTRCQLPVEAFYGSAASQA